MTKTVERFFSDDVARMEEGLAYLQKTVPNDAEAGFDTTYARLCDILTTIQGACTAIEKEIADDEALLQSTRVRFQAALAPWFDASWVGLRARTKPRGYAGDYKLLTVLYNQRPVSTGLSGYIDLYIIDLLLAHSIRSRWQKIRQFLVGELAAREGDVSILNVASGACREYAEPLEPMGDREIHLQCLDNDQEALDFVREKVVERSGIADFRLDRYNALRLISSAQAMRKFGTFDIVYSIGLYDYIPDEPLIAILRSSRELLKPGGVVYLNFKDTDAYDKTPYQWFLDWHFFQRTVDDCKRLFAAAGYDMETMTMSRDESGVIVNFISRVPQKTFRVDLGSDASAANPHSLQQPSQQDSKEA